MNKIAIILTDNTESSIKTLSEEIASGLSGVYSVDIFSIKQNNIFSKTDNIKPLKKYFWALRRYDIIHLQTAIPISFAPLIKLFHPNATLLSTEHDFGLNYFRNTLPFIKSFFLGLSLNIGKRFCIKNSYPSNALFFDTTKKKKITSRYAVVYNGIRDFYSLTDNSINNTTKTVVKKIVVVGNYYYSKGMDLILSIVRDYPDIEFHLFGDVLNGLTTLKKKELQPIITRKNVFIHGKVERNFFINFLMNERCIVCIPSRSESFSLVALEAMASAHPIVVSNIPVFHEITDSSFAVMFNIDDIASLKQSINYAFHNYDELGYNAREMFLDKFTSKKMIDEYHQLYDSLLKIRIKQ